MGYYPIPAHLTKLILSVRPFEIILILCKCSLNDMQMQRLLNLSWMYSMFLKFANSNVESRANVLDDRIRMQRNLVMSILEHISNQNVPHSCKLDSEDQGSVIRRSLGGIEVGIQQLTSNI